MEDGRTAWTVPGVPTAVRHAAHRPPARRGRARSAPGADCGPPEGGSGAASRRAGRGGRHYAVTGCGSVAASFRTPALRTRLLPPGLADPHPPQPEPAVTPPVTASCAADRKSV